MAQRVGFFFFFKSPYTYLFKSTAGEALVSITCSRAAAFTSKLLYLTFLLLQRPLLSRQSDSLCFHPDEPPRQSWIAFTGELPTNSLFFGHRAPLRGAPLSSNVFGNGKLFIRRVYMRVYVQYTTLCFLSCAGLQRIRTSSLGLLLRVSTPRRHALCIYLFILNFFLSLLHSLANLLCTLFVFKCESNRTFFFLPFFLLSSSLFVVVDLFPSTMSWPTTVGWTESRRRCTGTRTLPGRFPRSTT